MWQQLLWITGSYSGLGWVYRQVSQEKHVISLLTQKRTPKTLLRRNCAAADFLQKWDRTIQFRSQGLHISICTLRVFISGILSCHVNVHPSASLMRYSLCRFFTLLPSSQWLHALRAQGCGERWVFHCCLRRCKLGFIWTAEQISAGCCQKPTYNCSWR